MLITQSAAQSVKRSEYEGAKPKYVFCFIGDGMGFSQISLTERYLKATDRKEPKLNWSEFPYHGYYTTHATNRVITASAAGGTALATGEKTSVNSIGVDASKTKPLLNVSELSQQHGMKVGIVTSVSLDNATPASFYAHQTSRSKYYEISLDLSKSGFNYFAGGGFKRPEGNDKKDEKNIDRNMGGLGSDKKVKGGQPNSLDVAKQRGYSIINTYDGFHNLKKGDDKLIVSAPQLAHAKSIAYGIDQGRYNEYISLADLTQKGIEVLDNKKGFFMMVEGGKIDWSCHANDAATTIKEVLELEKAVEVAFDFYKKHPKETLIIVCADHETGGLSMGSTTSGMASDFTLLQHQNVSYNEFKKIIQAYKEEHKDNYKFEDVLQLITKHFGLGEANKNLAFTDYDLKRLKDAFISSMFSEVKQESHDDHYRALYGYRDPITVTTCHIFAEKAGIDWTTFAHSANDVPVSAIGVGEELFNGYFDNSDIGKNLMFLIKK